MRRVLDRVAAGLAEQRRTPHDPGHHVEFGVLRHRFVDRDAEVLAFARVQPMDQPGDDADDHLVAGNVIGVPKLRRDRRGIVMLRGVRIVAAIHHDAAQCQVHQVG